MIDSVSKENLTHNAPIYSVGEISIAIKTKIEKNFDHVRIRGEISGFKKATSGHQPYQPLNKKVESWFLSFFSGK